MENYKQQINEIAALAKEINYDIDSDIKPLVDLWLKRATASHKALTENPEQSKRVIKSFISKTK